MLILTVWGNYPLVTETLIKIYLLCENNVNCSISSLYWKHQVKEEKWQHY